MNTCFLWKLAKMTKLLLLLNTYRCLNDSFFYLIPLNHSGLKKLREN